MPRAATIACCSASQGPVAGFVVRGGHQGRQRGPAASLTAAGPCCGTDGHHQAAGAPRRAGGAAAGSVSIRDATKRVKQALLPPWRHPELLAITDVVSFPDNAGRLNKATPVVGLEGWLQILALLPGAAGQKFPVAAFLSGVDAFPGGL